MKIVCVSDTHRQERNIRSMPSGDVLIHSGDFSGNGELIAYSNISQWMLEQPFKHKIMIWGNHEVTAEKDPEFCRSLIDPSIHVLTDQEVILDGIKYYGSPYTPRFYDWAFQLDRGTTATKDHWDQIPSDVDVLITHGPPFGILDVAPPNRPVGDVDLLNKVLSLPKLKLHVYGHVHAGYGVVKLDFSNITFINASTCTESYKPKNPPIVVTI